MYILLASFFISLLGIMLMIGHKLALSRGGQTIELDGPHPLVLDIQKIKYSLIENAKKYEHLALVLIIRFYIRSSKFLKQSYEEVKTKIRSQFMKTSSMEGEFPEKQEVSGFLKGISDYKHRIRRIKHKIKKEEGN